MFTKLWVAFAHRLRSEDGAATVDWVVLTGVVIVLCVTAGTLMSDVLTTGGTTIQTKMATSP